MVSWHTTGVVQDSEDEKTFSLSDVDSASPLNDSEDELAGGQEPIAGGAERPLRESPRTSLPAPSSPVDTPDASTTRRTSQQQVNDPIDNFQYGSVCDQIEDGIRSSSSSSLSFHSELDSDRDGHGNFDVPSSPESQRNKSAVAEYHNLRLNRPQAPRPQPVILIDNTKGDSIVSQGLSNPPPENEHHGEVGERRFRTRKAIQVHPYALEIEQYRRSLQNRGVKPVMIAAQIARNFGQETETQEYSFEGRSEENENQQSSGPGPSSQESANNSVNTRVFTGEHKLPDFPDIDSLSRSPIQGELRQGFKRRKTEDFNDQSYLMPSSRVSDNQSETAHSEQLPISTSRPTRRSRKKFKFPRGYSPPQLPTPDPSSEPNTLVQAPQCAPAQNSPRIAIPIQKDRSSSSVLRTGRPSRPVPISISSSSGSSSDTDSTREDQLCQVQRRIRGVLPASWLRLDKQADCATGPGKTQARAQPMSSTKPSSQKGVARRINQMISPNHFRTSPGHHHSTYLEALDATASQMSDTGIKGPKFGNDADLTYLPSFPNIELNDIDDIRENDWIDPMLPKAAGNPLKRSIKRKKQRKLTDFHRSENTAPEPHQVAAQRRNLTGLKSSQHRKQWVRRKSVSRLSILDRANSPTQNSAPAFVRIAQRQARLRNNFGRHSPSHKIMLMHTMEEGREVDNVFSNWKNGHISKNFIGSERGTSQRDIGRTPLSEKSHNHQSGLPFSQKSAGAQRASSRPLQKYFPKTEIERETLKTPKNRLDAHPVSLASLQQNSRNAGTRRLLESTIRTPYHRAQKHQAPLFARQGQLEGTEHENDKPRSNASFMETLQSLGIMQNGRRSRLTKLESGSIARFLEDNDLNPQGSISYESDDHAQKTVSASVSSKHREATTRTRKRPPRWMDIEQLEVHLRENQTPDVLPAEVPDATSDATKESVQGLAPFGTRYTVDFGISPLPTGVFFRQNTFLGNGELRDALHLHRRNLEEPAGRMLFDFQNEEICLGPWTEETSVQLDKIFQTVVKLSTFSAKEIGQENQMDIVQLETVLRKIIRYFSKTFSLLDAIDRRLMVTKSLHSITSLVHGISAGVDDIFENLAVPGTRKLLIRLLMFSLVLSAQVLQISRHPLVDETSQKSTEAVCQQALQKVLHWALGREMPQFISFLDPAIIKYTRDIGISDQEYVLEAFVVAHNIYCRFRFPDCDFGSICGEILIARLPSICCDIQKLEEIWLSLFAILPFLEFDKQGLLHSRKRFDGSQDSVGRWQIVRDLLCRTFSMYTQNRGTSTINSYLRAALSRCYCLIRTWGWRKSEIILRYISSFFAERGLSLLSHEENIGSASFLENVDRDHTPQVQPSDNSFEIFLKILGVGLISMREVYDDKKIKNILWRFIPNHGRVLRKEDELRREELETIKNHHNLLCVLYYAAPPSIRGSLCCTQRVIDLESSHAEVCHVHVRAWATLARFQASEDENPDAIQGLVCWYDDILEALIQLHNFARTEAETAFAQTNQFLSHELLESMISGNQRQVNGILGHALNSMLDILERATILSNAAMIFERCHVTKVIEKLDMKQKGEDRIFSTILDAYQRYFSIKCRQHTISIEAAQSNNDSQDYGEFPLDGEEDGCNSQVTTEQSADQIQRIISDALHGASLFDDSLLAKLIETWVTAASQLVKIGRRDWTFYLDRHGPGSWFRLGDTVQIRQLTPFCLTSILNRDVNSFNDNVTVFLTGWLSSLVDRESLLKYQHLLTAAFLNRCPNHPLLQNLPFVHSNSDGLYYITLTDLRQRRMSLISTVLANMRYHLDSFLVSSNSSATSTLRQEYNTILTTAMAAMKRDYLETQTGSSSASRGTYINFVQTVIQFFLQYVADIHPIDRFFTDSAAFPLPEQDPLYVIGRIKSYAMHAADIRNQKKLATFVLTACERAAIEGQQVYLTNQLEAAVQGWAEGSQIASSLSLRELLLKAIFPAYVDVALTTANGYILAKPILDATNHITRGLLFTIDLNSETCILYALDMIAMLLSTALATLSSALSQNVPHRASFLMVLRQIFAIVANAMPLIDYAARMLQPGLSIQQSLMDLILQFIILARCLPPELESGGAIDLDSAKHERGLPRASLSHKFADMRAFTCQELRATLERSWVVAEADSVSEQKVKVLRPGARFEVTVEIGTTRIEKETLLAMLKGLVEMSSLLPAFQRGSEEDDSAEGECYDWM